MNSSEVQSRFFVGLDLGQKRDFSAVAVVERVSVDSVVYHLRYLERIALGTPYPAIVDRVYELLKSAALCGSPTLVTDATGVGLPVVDLLHKRGISPVAVTITGGSNVSGRSDVFRVPKRILISALVRLFETGRLKIADGIPSSTELVQELLDFKVRINPRTRHESYEAGRRDSHDDIVLAVALACWYGECTAVNCIPILD
jgi:hypothetical protein